MRFWLAIVLVGGLGQIALAGSLGGYAFQVRDEVIARMQHELKAHSPGTITGIVTHACSECFFLQRGEEAIKIIETAGRLPQRGEIVAVDGAPSFEGGHTVLVAKSWKKCGSAELPAPVEANEKTLVFAAERPEDLARDLNGRRVRVKGRTVGTVERGFGVDIGSLPVTVTMDEPPGFIDTCAQTRPIVEVTGVLETVLDQSALFGRDFYVLGVKIHADEPEDVVLKADPVYLVNVGDRRMRLGVIAAFTLLAFAFVALCWWSVRQARRRLRTKTLMNERKRMADDLHDTIEQHLVGASMLLQLGKMKEARDILIRAKREMRDIVWGLKNDDMMRLTPSEMLAQFAKEENRKGLYRIEAKTPGLPDRMDAAEMRDMSLIVREAVGNAVKHGGAKKIAIVCDPLEDGGWLMKIGNDGLPFDPAKAPGVEEGHFGLEGMRSRARRIGAELKFENRGDRVVLTLEKRK